MIDISKVNWLYDDFWYRKRPYFLYQSEGRFHPVDFVSAIKYTSKPYIGRRAVISLSRSIRRFSADYGYIAEFLVRFPKNEQERCYIGTSNGWASSGEPPDEPHKGVYFRCYNDDEGGNWEAIWRRHDNIVAVDTGKQIHRTKFKHFKIVKSGNNTWKFDYYIDNDKVAEIVAPVRGFGTDLVPWVQVSSREDESKWFEIDALQLLITRDIGEDPPVV